MHSVKANYSAFCALKGGMHAKGTNGRRRRGQCRETIEPRLAACDWNPELTSDAVFFVCAALLIECDPYFSMEIQHSKHFRVVVCRWKFNEHRPFCVRVFFIHFSFRPFSSNEIIPNILLNRAVSYFTYLLNTTCFSETHKL